MKRGLICVMALSRHASEQIRSHDTLHESQRRRGFVARHTAAEGHGGLRLLECPPVPEKR